MLQITANFQSNSKRSVDQHSREKNSTNNNRKKIEHVRHIYLRQSTSMLDFFHDIGTEFPLKNVVEETKEKAEIIIVALK